MTPDRNTRIISGAVVSFAAILAMYLAWNPRGMPRSSGRSLHDSNTAQVDSVSFDPADVIGKVAGTDSVRAKTELGRWQRHYARLMGSNLEVTYDEMATVVGDTVHDAVATLRPYWLNNELDAVVRVGGQFVGDIAALNQIKLSAVEEMRLEFSPTEPHWIIQVFMAP